jgi:hypothetical protein
LQARVKVIDAQSLRRGRIVAYICAALFGLLAIWTLSLAIATLHITVVSGTVQQLYGVFRCGRTTCYYTLAECRSRKFDCTGNGGSAIRLVGDSKDYMVHPDTLHSPLSRWFVSSGDTVRLWFVGAPFVGTEVVAIRLLSKDGPTGVLHTNGGYTDAAGERNIFLGMAALSLAVAVGSWLLGRNIEPLAYKHPVIVKVFCRRVNPRHHKRSRGHFSL